mmetsp:Transcript_22263/g.69292  ORF Transcript_22263/g.69292 Transcript_22263/m.69292 type:complete len:144 (+) Transcript_22263:123-554(+)|eukprot:CAMPEP_0182902906 /NCGR_PEP_ID=MMETSP0034_2-20130328/30834_1 /TAXON_ID=156128 /ORGANISM="Nephroselmis pyriformis, Strain CCMP717" /LENGTH=143 /DNA_ID=CAMNT_0025037671 /DNA_START=93 /DNA_END=524 /DNA_ORIENTATION=+
MRAWRGHQLLALVALLAACSPLGVVEGKPKGKGTRRNTGLDKELQEIRADCTVKVDTEGGDCARDSVARENCIMRCSSDSCYQQVYGEDPLEEGEIDTARGRIFRNCARNELRTNKALAAEKASAEAAAQREREELEAKGGEL